MKNLSQEIFNKIMKTRGLLLKNSAEDILRFSAAKGNIEKSQYLRNSSKNDSSISGILLKAISAIDEPVHNKNLVEQIIKNSTTSKEPLNEVGIIYKDKELMGTGFESSGKKDVNDNIVKEHDIASYVGYNNISADSFNNDRNVVSRFVNPDLAVFKIRTNTVSLMAAPEASFVPVFTNLIPAIEMSRCAPHLSVTIIDDSDNNSNKMSLSKFIVGTKAFKSDGFAQGLSETTLKDNNDIVFKTAKKIQARSKGRFKPHTVSGMEIFQSPQALVNATINRFQPDNEKVKNPFRPFMSIESLSIQDYLAGYKLLSTSKATLSLKLFDRSRLAEIEKLIGVQYLASTSLIIEWGWNHPDGGITSNNPVGQFLDSIKRRELFKIVNSRSSINDDGTVSITLDLINIAADKIETNSLFGKYISISELNNYIIAIKKSLKENISKGDTRKSILKKEVFKNMGGKNANDIVRLDALNKIKFFERAEQIIFFDEQNAQPITKLVQDLIKDLDLLLRGGRGDAETPDSASLTNDINTVNQYSSQKPGELPGFAQSTGLNQGQVDFENMGTPGLTTVQSDDKIPQPSTEKTEEEISANLTSSAIEFFKDITTFLQEGDSIIQSSFIGDNTKPVINDTSQVLFRISKILDDNKAKINIIEQVESFTVKGETTEPFKRYITLGKLLLKVAIIPLVNTKQHDQVQVFFHRANHRSGAFYNLSLGDIFIDTERYLTAVRKLIFDSGQSDLTIEQHIQLIADILLSNNPYEIGYGISESNNDNDDGAPLDDESEKQAKKDRNIRLSAIYSAASPDIDPSELELEFQHIQLGIRMETIPYTENGYLRKLLKVHIFDKKTELYTSSRLMLEGINNTDINSIINSKISLNSINSFNITNKVKRFTRKSLNKKNVDKKSELSNIKNNQSIMKDLNQFVVTQVDAIIKSSVPTIEFGASSANIESISINNDPGGLANEINLYRFVTQKSNPQDPNDITKKDMTFINPGKLSIQMLGCPLISIGQEFYVTAGTNTTLDSIYNVESVSHTVSEGNFKTNVTLVPSGGSAYKSENLTKSIAEAIHFAEGIITE